MSVLKKMYSEKIKDQLKKELNIKNVMQVPRIKKIVLNTCVSQAVKEPKILNTVQKDISLIAGQRAVITKAKKAIANFKLREGMPIGSSVTLRRKNMWSFLDRFVHFALPQARDFKGLSPKGFDGRGNYNLGLKEHIIFPEINYDTVSSIRGMNISIVTTAKTDKEAFALLKNLKLPFRGN